MKKSRKFKKLFIAFLAATLSIIMFATQVSAASVVSYSGYFEHEGVVDAFEYICWDPREDFEYIMFALDLVCYECETVDRVEASMAYNVGYYLSETDDDPASTNSVSTDGSFYPWNTEDSDELILYIRDFDNSYAKTELLLIIYLEIFYINGDRETYLYEHKAEIIGDEMINYDPQIIEHIYIFNVDNEN